MPKKNDRTAEAASIMAELYELSIPGQLIGKEVIDSSARKIGVIRNVKITFPPTKVNIIIKGLDVEFQLSFDSISTIGWYPKSFCAFEISARLCSMSPFLLGKY